MRNFPIFVPYSTNMKGRTKIFSEEVVIDKAIEVFWAKGFEAASTEDLLEAMQIGKGSFYNSFTGGKKELFQKSLDQFSNKAMTRFRKQVAQSENPLEEIRLFFRSIAYDRKQAHLKGCFLGNTIAELALVEQDLKGKAVNLLKELENLFFEVLVQAKKSGQLKSKEDPQVLATSLITFWNGISITRRMYPDATVLEPLINLQLKIIN